MSIQWPIYYANPTVLVPIKFAWVVSFKEIFLWFKWKVSWVWWKVFCLLQTFENIQSSFGKGFLIKWKIEKKNQQFWWDFLRNFYKNQSSFNEILNYRNNWKNHITNAISLQLSDVRLNFGHKQVYRWFFLPKSESILISEENKFMWKYFENFLD